ncbi:GTP-binding 1 [Micractinium conductrix]|uniref:GTP-binding 1 n=1 Tax=Micractinium conductrix TaxID=554055 RepID=A0A2P6V6K9_9CHLO|nr:GTP-binding 1 [Micractinium conductrix]|eukprot:PSC69725.1 GTP-binding 1 [Micractinium conductrix]
MASATPRHRPAPHHLSKAAAAGDGVGDHEGWAEGIASLTAEQGGAALLMEESAGAGVKASDGAPAVTTPTLASEGVAAAGAAAALRGGGGAPATPEEERRALMEHALVALEAEVATRGEVVADLGAAGGYGPTGLGEAQLAELLAAVEARMAALGADVTVLRQRKLSPPAAGAPAPHAADVCIRRRGSASGGTPLEVRVAIIGNVDSGKSTMVGVLTRSVLDDGRGSARARVFKHSHEADTGRTSSVGQHTLCLDSRGAILNDAAFRTQSIADYVARAAKVVTLVDLAGHEKYFRTTSYGLTAHLPDYACLIVGANAGVVGMAKEHLGVALALRIPAFFVITKIDLAPEHVLRHTLQGLTSILKKPGVRKRAYLVRTTDDVLTCARHMHADALAPIFLTSSVTGQGLDLVRLFYNLLPQRHNWHERCGEAAEFIIDETFGVPGVGTVVAGTVKRGALSPNCTLLLGPDIGDASFKAVQVKSIHYKRLPVGLVVAGQTAALALKKVKRHQVRKGMVLVDAATAPKASWEFDADIAILTHSSTIAPRYQAVIHCEIVRQAARVIAMDRERLRSGDRACVRFRFLNHPEFLTPGTRFVFREGRTKGIGVVVGTAMSPTAPPASP